MGRPRPLPPVAAIALLALLAAGCRAGRRVDDAPGGAGTPPAEPAIPGGAGGAEPSPAPPRAQATVALGAYEGDERVAGLAGAWPAVVARVLERMELVTGLAFADGPAPRALLEPLGDERVPWTARSEIAEGRRRPVVRVNLEWIAAGRGGAEPLLARALAAAAFETVALRFGPRPAWLAEAAGTAAAGDLDAVLARLVEEAALGGADRLRVDPADPGAREATAAAALALLLEREDPGALRGFFAFAADGDPPDDLLARTVRDPEGQWAGAGRAALAARLAGHDPGAWAWIAGAEAALREAGPAAMRSRVPDPVPEEAADEARLLRARGAAEEGDWAAALAELRALSPAAPSRLRDPEGAARLRAEAEARAGDAALGRRLLEAWRRDHPRAAAAEDGGTPEEGAPSPDLADAQQTVEALLLEHRIGAARRALDALGERALAPELEGAARAVEAAWAEPSDEALQANGGRVRAWLEVPGEATAALVRDGGPAVAPALRDALPAEPGVRRRAVVRLLAEATDAPTAVAALREGWAQAPRLLAGDVDALAGVFGVPALETALPAGAPEVLASADAQALWERARLGMDPAWLLEHPRLRQDLDDPRYPVRRAAFDRATGDTAPVVSPLLVAHALADSAALLRRDAVRVAAVHGFPSLVRLGLEDEAWVVRQAAAGAARALGPDAVPALLRRLASDTSQEVRAAAARSLAALAPRDPAVLDALVATQAEEEPRVREEVMEGLDVLDRGEAARALARAIDAETARPTPRPPVLYRLTLAFRRVTGRDLGYWPGMPPAPMRAMAETATRVAAPPR